MLRSVVWSLSLVLSFGCAAASTTVEVSGTDERLEIEGITRCEDDTRGSMDLDPDRPLSVFVHGCDSSAGRFKAMAQVFEAQGKQSVCFNYDDRDLLETSAASLSKAIATLQAHRSDPSLIVIGHSQGGLVARRAFVEGGGLGTSKVGGEYRLVTVSSPFNGIRASRHCGQPVRHILTLGISAALCRAVTGKKWREIHPSSDMVKAPGTLVDGVVSALKVVTDERGTCRRYDEDGSCAQDDFVFSLEEQYNPAVDKDPRVVNVEVDAGHVEIVGDEGLAPRKLIDVLQDHRVLDPIEEERKIAFERLLERLF